MRYRWPLAAAVAAAVGLSMQTVQAQQPTVEIDDNEITINGCVTPLKAPVTARPDLLIWSRSDIMLAGAAALNAREPGASDLAQRVFYWLDDDDDLTRHAGQRVEVRGELEDFDEGEIEIERDGDFASITLDLDGETQEARVPIAWLGPGVADHDMEIDFMARKIDVEDVEVLGPCGRSNTNF